MSLQQSEAHQDRMRETMADGLPPPSAKALQRASAKNERHRRQALAATKRREEIAEAAALGVAVVAKITVDKTWTDDEDAVVRALYPHYAQMVMKLPHRSRSALQRRARLLDVVPARKVWTTKETATLQRLWSSATTDELVAALPRWEAHRIDDRARYLGLPPRGRRPLAPTGDGLCDEIRDRCRILGYTMGYLDRIARSGAYFQSSEWKSKNGHRLTPMVRAVRALGGELRVEWPD